MDIVDLVERYYKAIDDADGDALESVLAPGFRHNRPDRTLDGRDRFVEFMLAERPRTDTVHTVDSMFLPEERESNEVAVQGRLFDDDGSELFAFVDLFTVDDDSITDLRTFTN